MYTKEDFLRDNPPGEYHFAFPWEQEYHQRKLQEAKEEIARKMREQGFDVALIADITGLSAQDIFAL